ncbi:MAG: branched-chain amino acid ABC transporter permease [Actinobacteria bacterium]|nr:branched-chain amino acid ABC transporter permease [Actinomycetota bacterium]
MQWDVVAGNALREAFGPQAAWFALMAIGLNVHYGYTGLLNFGQIGFAMVGAYGVGVAVQIFGLSLWVGIAVGIVAALVLAVALGLPTLRLRGDYFAIVTIAAAEVIRLVFGSNASRDLTGGPFGLRNVANAFYELNPLTPRRYTVFGNWSYLHGQLWSMLVTWALVAAATYFVYLLVRSPWGRVIRGIREDEDAVRSLGKNAFWYKMQSLMIGGAIGGLGGIMLTIQTSAVTPLTFRPQQTFFAYAILIVGGAATTFGPVIGTMIFWFLFSGVTSMLRQLASQGLVPPIIATEDSIGALVLALVGLAVILLMIYRPQGIFGSKRELILDV